MCVCVWGGGGGGGGDGSHACNIKCLSFSEKQQKKVQNIICCSCDCALEVKMFYSFGSKTIVGK